MIGIIRILANQAKGTFHPIVYLESPLPGEYKKTNPIRLKSKMHHTSGIESKEEALDDVNNLAARLYDNPYMILSEVYLDINEMVEWNGEDFPLDTIIVNYEVLNQLQKVEKR